MYGERCAFLWFVQARDELCAKLFVCLKKVLRSESCCIAALKALILPATVMVIVVQNVYTRNYGIIGIVV
jgi:hypothetical protein